MFENKRTRLGTKVGLALAGMVAALWAGAGVAASADPATNYDKARWDPIHFSPEIEKATDEQCLTCHQEILSRTVRAESQVGQPAANALAWYQTLDTYKGSQDTFHRRHLATDYAKRVMDLKCNFCHLGNDPREESPGAPGRDDAGFTLRKMVDPSETCLLCHGRFPFENMEGLEGPWKTVRVDLEDEDNPNGCQTCHAELFRTVRHQVTYLKPAAIEEAAKSGSDVCYGCHGGRAWYRTSYPYARHPWPDMPEETPDWAKDRPTESKERFRLEVTTAPEEPAAEADEQAAAAADEAPADAPKTQ